ncbi:pyridoxal phosphate-dependent aminotransferase [Pseudochelatococcus sp. G4_1912]|uniref:pyridoxal phosphate-dependent aminotransferase n=1 Tax=Pseudochelatococcus sp. G4_1912 TaxID=3114288 RepID=UPI0039C69DE3
MSDIKASDIRLFDSRNPARQRRAAERLSHVSPFLAMDVLSAAKSIERAGGSVIHMELGEPSSPTPRVIREAAQRALEIGKISYTEALGRDSLRERISRYYRDIHNVHVHPARIVITTGSSAGFVLSFLALFEPGARIAVSAPGYPAYRNIFTALGLEAVPVPLDDSNGWMLTGAAIARLHAQKPLDGVLAMSPANPSGVTMERATLAALAQNCRSLGIWLISDEIYHGLTYGMQAETALAFDDEAIIVNSFSKYYCMTGWRIGWLVLPEELVRGVERLAQNLYISPPLLSQIAAEAAFDATDELEVIKAGYAANRDLLLNELPKIGLGRGPIANGAFYLYIDVSHLSDNSLTLSQNLLNKAGVAVTPGLDFDPENGAAYIRLSYAGSLTDCREAVTRLHGFITANH